MSGNVRKLIAEVLGTYALVLFGGLAILAAAKSGAATPLLVIAFGFGLGLMVGLYAFGEVSGGHFNPAVSLAMALDGRMTATDMVAYWIAQIVGGVLAALTILVASSQAAVAGTATVLAEDVSVGSGFLLEALFTALFVAVILKATTSDASSPSAFLAISLTLLIVHVVLVPFTGTGVNPARSLGPGIVGNVWTDQWIYWIAPLVGSAVGWGLYRAVSAERV